MKKTALLLSLFALAPLVAARAEDPATNAPAADPAAIAGAKAVIAAALRPEPKPAAETNGWDRFLLAVRALEDRQAETRGAVDPAAWLAAVDLALAADPDAKRTIDVRDAPKTCRASVPSVRACLSTLLAVLPGSSGWDAIRAGLRERAERLAAETAAGTAAATEGEKEPVASAVPADKTDGKDEKKDGKKDPDGRPVLLAALRVAADFLGGGGRGAPESLAALAALPPPESLPTNRQEKAVAALRRAMENPGVPAKAPFSAERLLRQIDRLRRTGRSFDFPDALATVPDEVFAPVAARLFAPTADGEKKSWAGSARWWKASDAVKERLLAAAAADPAAGGAFGWEIAKGSKPSPAVRALFAALVAAEDPLGAIRRRMDEARADRAAFDGTEDGEEFDESDPWDDDDDELPFGWDDRHETIGKYASTLVRLLVDDLDANRLADAEALAAPLSTNDWRAVLKLCDDNRLRVTHPTEAWRAFCEARLPSGEALLKSPFLSVYADACLPDKAERFENTCVRLLGDAASGEKAKKKLDAYRRSFARSTGDLDALEADFLERTDPSPKDAGADADYIRDWCRALEALGETNRLSRALDRVVALHARSWKEAGVRRSAPVWAVPILARAGRFADAEAVARDALAAGERSSFWMLDDHIGAPGDELLGLYVLSGHPTEALDFAAGWPRWSRSQLVREELDEGRGSRAASLARALADAGGETNAAVAAAIARAAVENDFSGRCAHPQDWPFEVLLDTMPGAELRAFLDGLSRIDPYEERPWQWKAESLRREGDLAGAEAAARRALEIDPTDGESPAGDRVRSYSILASVLEDRGGEADLSEAATLRRVVAAVRAAEKGDELTDLGYLAGAIARYDEAASLFSDAYCVQWRLAERLRKAGRADEAAAHYEETFRHMPAQFGQVASLCFGCEGVFSSKESAGAAERILPALAAAPGAGASVHYLLGMLREHQKKYDEAWAAWSRALEVDPGHFDALKELLSLRDEVERPAADWAKLQERARMLDPFLANHSEDPARIVDWPGLWRAFEEAAAGAPAPWKAPEGPLFRFEAAERVAAAADSARRAAEDEIAREAGAAALAEEEDKKDSESGRIGAKYLPARKLATGGGRYWASRLVDLASALAADPKGSRSDAMNYCAGEAFALSAGDASYDYGPFGSDDDYFWDD